MPTRPFSLTRSDIEALEALAPKLTGGWTLDLWLDAGDVTAVFVRDSDYDLSHFYMVTRSGPLLSLTTGELPLGPEPLGTYGDITELAEHLGDIVG